MSYQVIARKYRPQTFDEVVGQRLITDTLKNAIVHDRVAHGYIFSGGRGVGKTTTARVLAKSLNCVNGPTVTPCGVCDSCREITAGNSVDVLEIDAASNRGIDEIRELRETVRYLPSRDRYKIFIIDEVHMLTTEAFNALLKTLEEPPPRSLFILATTEPHKLPTTIQSRCQHFSFRLLDYAEIYAQLEHICAAEKIHTDEKALAAVAQAAEGSLRDGLSVLDQVIAACGDDLDEARVRQLLGVVPVNFMAGLMQAIQAADSKSVLESIDQLASEGYELGHFTGELTRFVRNLMVAKSCGAASSLLQLPSDERKILGELSAVFGEEDLSRFFQILLRTESELRHALAPRFHLELGLMKLVHAGKLASLEALLGDLSSGARQGPAPGSAAAGGSRPGAPRSAAPGYSGTVVGASKPSAQTETPGRSTHSNVRPAPLPSAPLTPPGPVSPPNSAIAKSQAPVAAAPARVVAPVPAREASASSLTDPRLAAIRAAIFAKSKLLATALDPLLSWQFESGEARFVFAPKDKWFADLLNTRERQEILQAAAEQVLGGAVKIRVTLGDGEMPRRQAPDRLPDQAPAQTHAQRRVESDPVVEAFRKRFDCTLVEVEDLSQE